MKKGVTHLLLAALIACPLHSGLPFLTATSVIRALSGATAWLRLVMASLRSPDFALGGLRTTVRMRASSVGDTAATTSGARRRGRGQSVHQSRGCI